MLTEEQIHEIRQAIEVYDAADDMETNQRARFVIEIHAPDWTRLLLDDVEKLQQQNKQLIEALREIKAKEWELAGEDTPIYVIAHFALKETEADT